MTTGGIERKALVEEVYKTFNKVKAVAEAVHSKAFDKLVCLTIEVPNSEKREEKIEIPKLLLPPLFQEFRSRLNEIEIILLDVEDLLDRVEL